MHQSMDACLIQAILRDAALSLDLPKPTAVALQHLQGRTAEDRRRVRMKTRRLYRAAGVLETLAQ